MSAYKDAAMVEELRQFHLAIGKRFEPMADHFVQEAVVAKMLRCEVGLIIHTLTRREQIEWSAAMARKEFEFAASQGWTLSGEIPALLKREFGPTFDFPAFADFWSKHVPPYVVVDMDRDFCPGMETGKTWVEHILRYLHHVPLFYREAQ